MKECGDGTEAYPALQLGSKGQQVPCKDTRVIISPQKQFKTDSMQ